MPKVKSSESKSNGSALNFEAQLCAAAEQAVPAPHYGMTEYNRARPEGTLQSAKSSCRNRRVNRDFSFCASNDVPRSRERDLSRLGKRRKEFAASKGRRPNERARVSHWMSAGQVRVVGEKQFNAERVGLKCRNSRMSRRGIQSVRGQRWPCASTPGGNFLTTVEFVKAHANGNGNGGKEYRWSRNHESTYAETD